MNPHLKTITIFCVLLLCAGGCSHGFHTVSLRVIDQSTRQPIDDVDVGLHSENYDYIADAFRDQADTAGLKVGGLTAANGTFSLKLPNDERSFWLWLMRKGYKDACVICDGKDPSTIRIASPGTMWDKLETRKLSQPVSAAGIIDIPMIPDSGSAAIGGPESLK